MVKSVVTLVTVPAPISVLHSKAYEFRLDQKLINKKKTKSKISPFNVDARSQSAGYF